MSAEWSRPERIDTIGAGERTVAIEADATERAALAERFGLVAIERLAATLSIRRDPSGILATGRVTASVVQACSVTDDPLPLTIDEPLALRFVEDMPTGDEIELSEDALDIVQIEGGAIDLGEAAAETMALAIDPFPRGPNAAAALRAAGVISEEEARPAGALAGLKGLFERR